MGHFYLSLLVFFIQCVIFSEIIALKRNYLKEEPVKLNTKINWYFFFVGSIYFYCRCFYDEILVEKSPFFRLFFEKLKLIFFSLYIAGFIMWVTTLKKGFLRYQVRLFFWTHSTLIVVLTSSTANALIYEGMVWWLTSVVMVVLNDTCAYFVGRRFGRTKLIDISPNKTLEGFIGGFVLTLVGAWVWNRLI